MKTQLPQSTIARLCLVFRLCEELEQQGAERVSSTQIGRELDVAPHTIRKDFNHLGEIGHTGSGYAVVELRQHLSRALGFEREHRACIVGLGRLGSAILAHETFGASGFTLVAGFDASINRVETLQAQIPLHPAYDIIEVVQREAIRLAVIAVPRVAAQEVADALVAGGVRGIINFAPVVIKPHHGDVAIRNVNVVNEMRILSSILTLRTCSADGSC